MATAWMIRNDGKAIPVTQHIYADPAEIEETLYAAEWLYQNTRHDSVKSLAVQLIRKWAETFEDTNLNLVDVIKKEIDSRPYKFLSKDFIDSIDVDLYAAKLSQNSLEELSAAVEEELNQEFLRARYGGLYNTNSSSKEMVFRISSKGFNWYNIIFNFVAATKFKIATITIVRDEEATGEKNFFYRTHDGRAFYNNLPIEDFYAESGNPVVEHKSLYYTNSAATSVYKSLLAMLASGSAICDLFSLPMNRDRIKTKLAYIECLENTRNKRP